MGAWKANILFRTCMYVYRGVPIVITMPLSSLKQPHSSQKTLDRSPCSLCETMRSREEHWETMVDEWKDVLLSLLAGR